MSVTIHRPSRSAIVMVMARSDVEPSNIRTAAWIDTLLEAGVRRSTPIRSNVCTTPSVLGLQGAVDSRSRTVRS